MSANVISLVILAVGWLAGVLLFKVASRHYQRDIDRSREEMAAVRASAEVTLGAIRAENERTDRLHAEWRKIAGTPEWDEAQRAWAEQARLN